MKSIQKVKRRLIIFSLLSLVFIQISSNLLMAQIIVPPGYTSEVYAVGLNNPTGIAVAPYNFGSFEGHLFVANYGVPNGTDDDFISRVSPDGSVFNFANVGTSDPFGIKFGPGGNFGGNLFVATNTTAPGVGDSRVLEIEPTGNTSTFSITCCSGSGGIDFDLTGDYGSDMFIGLTGPDDGIGRVLATGFFSTFFNFPYPFPGFSGGSVGIEFGSGGDFGTEMFVAVSSFSPALILPGIYKISPSGTISTLANTSTSSLIGQPGGLSFAQGGVFGEDLYVTDAVNGTILRINSLGIVSVFVSGLSSPYGIVFSSPDTLYIVEQGLNRVVKINPFLSLNTFQLTVSIDSGWNMVSAPGLNPVNQNVNTWWINKDPAANVFKFNSGYQTVTEVEPATGYWMKHLGNQIYNTGDEWPPEGILFVPYNSISANAGWNLIGGYDYNAIVSGIQTNPPGLLEGSVFGYSSGYQVADELVPGFGYWIKLSSSGQIILPPPIFKNTAKINDPVLRDWGKIIITDNEGRYYTLYAINGNVNLEEYELPPVPPSGIFDIRYSSGRFAEDLRAGIQSIEMKGVVYPVSIKVENICINVQDETGNDLNVVLKPDEEISINNNMISKLFVIENFIPNKYSLMQNYPNPFNPNTIIKYDIPTTSHVTLKIFDMLGQEVAKLVDEEQSAAHYQVEWNATNVASGVYFYMLRAKNFIQTKKMLLLK